MTGTRRASESNEVFSRPESPPGNTVDPETHQPMPLARFKGVLQLFATALAGRELAIGSTADAPAEVLPQGGLYPLTDGKTIYLPPHLDDDLPWEESFSRYKVLAAHQAGYVEFGTFDFDIRLAADRLGLNRIVRAKIEAGPLLTHFELFFSCFDLPQLARDLFFMAEDARVDFRLRRQYRGLAGDLDRAVMASLETRPASAGLPLREALVEALLGFALTGRPDHFLPAAVRPLYETACRTLTLVLQVEATVIDAAEAAARIYVLFRRLPNVYLGLADLSLDRFIGEGEPIGLPLNLEAFQDQTPLDQDLPYHQAQGVPFHGQTDPEIVQLASALELLKEAAAGLEGQGSPLPMDLIKELLKKGAKITISQLKTQELAGATGLFVTDLEDLLQEKIEELSAEKSSDRSARTSQARLLKSSRTDRGRVFYYDEWDYLIEDYRPDWCRLREIKPENGSNEKIERIQKENQELITNVRRRFQRLRPELLRLVRRLPSGQDLDLDEIVKSIVDLKAGLTPSTRIYQNRERQTADVATAFLLDLSASTIEKITEPCPDGSEPWSQAGELDWSDYFSLKGLDGIAPSAPDTENKRVIDLELEAVVIMAEALEGLSHEFGIFGFSGYGRDNVEFFTFKDFGEKHSLKTRSRLGAVKPYNSTRMGPAIRHTLLKLARMNNRLKTLILLSDGYPQDYDYGPDRSSREYGLRDTMMALQEARRMNIHTFLITVDQAGHDYLGEMCPGENYLVVKRPSALPRVLPRVYSGLTV